ncbi:MAG: hypothetical protein ABIK28_11030 [Planctomycetota bacterium]
MSVKIKHWAWVPILAGMLLSAGCTMVPKYDILVNGYLDHEGGFVSGTRFFVLHDEHVPNPLFDKELSDQVNELLVKAGHRTVVTVDEADFCVRFCYGTGSSPQLSTEYFEDPFMPYPFYGYYGCYGPRWGFYHSPRIVNTVRTLHTHSLTLQVLEAETFRKEGVAKPAWVGETSCSTTSPDLRAALHFMLYALFQYFGEDTKIGRIVTLERTTNPTPQVHD